MPRFSLLAFYNELFPVKEKRLRLGLYLAAVYNVVCFLVTIGVDTVWCGIDIGIPW